MRAAGPTRITRRTAGRLDAMTHKFDPRANQQLLLAAAAQRDETAAQGNRVFQAVSDDLKQRIRRGEWLPGERLPSISQLAKDLEVSTGSVREALRSLQSIGLVKIEHGRGVFVTSARPSTELA